MIAAPPDLLVIGGLTVDRLPDGASAPGGSVLHIARAMAARGVRVAVITASGPEPEAQAGIEELHALASAVEAATATCTATFEHRDAAAGRQLSLERRGGRIEMAGSALLARAPAVLLAPIAGEFDTDDLPELASTPVRAAILQGWLRSLDEGAEVRPLPLAAMGQALDALAGFDLLVASREDLLAEADEPRAQLAALRRALGSHPELVVTDGAEGLWLDGPAAAAGAATVHHLPVPWRVDGVSSVGAGDILAAFLTIGEGGLDDRAAAAMRIVAEILEARVT